MFGNVVHARRTLGAITAQQAVSQALATESNINPKDASGWLSPSAPGWDSSLQAADIYLDPVCAGQPAPNLNLFQTASGLALGTSSAGVGIAAQAGAIAATTASIATIAILGVGVVIAVLEVIFAHHAAAVKRDIAAECSTIPAVNNALQLIIQGVQDGKIDPQAGIAGLQALPDKFLQAVGPAKNNSPYCNALCEKLITLRAICFYWISKFQDMSAQAASSPTPAAPASLTIPNTPRPAPTVSVPTAASSGSWLTQNSILPFAPNWALLLLGGLLLTGEL